MPLADSGLAGQAVSAGALGMRFAEYGRDHPEGSGQGGQRGLPVPRGTVPMASRRGTGPGSGKRWQCRGLIDTLEM